MSISGFEKGKGWCKLMRWRYVGLFAVGLCAIGLTSVTVDADDVQPIDLLVTGDDVWADRARFFVEEDSELANILASEDPMRAEIDEHVARAVEQLTNDDKTDEESDEDDTLYQPTKDVLALAKKTNRGDAIQLYPEGSDKAASVIALANEQLGIDYVWGGKSPSGFDCSGLTQYVFRHALGVEIGEWTLPQSQYGERIPVSEAQPGDLYFWGEGVARHVALAVGDNMYIHAPQPGTVVRYNSTSWYMPDYAVRMFDD